MNNVNYERWTTKFEKQSIDLAVIVVGYSFPFVSVYESYLGQRLSPSLSLSLALWISSRPKFRSILQKAL